MEEVKYYSRLSTVLNIQMQVILRRPYRTSLHITGTKKFSKRRLSDSGASGFFWLLRAARFPIPCANQRQILLGTSVREGLK